MQITVEKEIVKLLTLNFKTFILAVYFIIVKFQWFNRNDCHSLPVAYIQTFIAIKTLHSPQGRFYLLRGPGPEPAARPSFSHFHISMPIQLFICLIFNLPLCLNFLFSFFLSVFSFLLIVFSFFFFFSPFFYFLIFPLFFFLPLPPLFNKRLPRREAPPGARPWAQAHWALGAWDRLRLVKTK